MKAWITRTGLLGLATAALLMTTTPTWANAKTILVDDNKVECPTAVYSGSDGIQKAVDNATDGDTILVCSGTYSPVDIGIHPPSQDASVTLKGVPGPNNALPLIDATGTGKTALEMAEVSPETVQGFRIKGDSGSNQPAVEVAFGGFTLSDLRVEGGKDGIVFGDDSYGSLSKSTIAHADNAGVYMHTSGKVTISDNTVSHNGTAGVAADDQYMFHVTIENNFITFSGIGLFLDNARGITALNNTIKHNTDGVFLAEKSTGNHIIGTTISSSKHNGIYVGAASRTNTFDGNVIRKSAQLDVQDETIVDSGGTGTANTFNHWSTTACITSSPEGLCASAPLTPTPGYTVPTPVTTAPPDPHLPTPHTTNPTVTPSPSHHPTATKSH